MKTYNETEAFELSMDIGAAIIQCGGEVKRAEDTVRRINMSFGARQTEVSALQSLIVATVITKSGISLTQSRRIKSEIIDLSELERLNSLSRRICAGDRSFIELTKGREYPLLLDILCTVLATGAFCIYFGGTLADAVFSAVIGLIITYYHFGFELPLFVSVLIDGTVSGILSFCPSILGFHAHPDKIMIGTIMLLVPGLTVSNAVRDIVSGDIAAGMVRLVDAVFTALAIAFGYAAAVAVFGGDYLA